MFALNIKHNTMKKHLLLIALAFMTLATVAQNDMYSFVYHDKPGHFINLHNPMQQRDGDFVVCTYIYEDMGNHNSNPLGYMFYKISPTTLTVTDSLFVADTDQRSCLLARDPYSEGNIRASYEYHEDCDSTFLRIRHFPDNDLHTNPDEDIVTPVCEGFTICVNGGTLIDCRNDLIMKYYKERPNQVFDEYVARFAADGTLKYQTLFKENTDGTDPLRVLKEAPLQYYQYNNTGNYPNDNLALVVTDSLFQRNTVILNKILREEVIDTLNNKEYEYLSLSNISGVEVIPVGGNDILVAAPYVHDTNFNSLLADYGVAIAKYDMRTMSLKGYTVFDNQLGYCNTRECMGLKKMTDGAIYFAYKKVHEPNINIVKMDTDLNVEWERFCKIGNIIMYSAFGFSSLYEDGQGNEKGIAWTWYANRTGNDRIGFAHFFLNHDGTVGTNEAGIEIRPYAYYPNPTQDRLRLQYSPDVQPKQVELYDLQGRLVRSQNQGLESLDMQGLASGQYLMKVTLEDGKSFTDKVVKE